MNAGRITVLGYLALFLILPMFGLQILGRPEYSSYHFSGMSFLTVALAAIIAGACFTPLFNEPAYGKPNGSSICTILYRLLQRLILPICIALSLAFVLLFDPDAADYRYSGAGIAGHGMSFFVALALKPVMIAILIWIMAEYLRNPVGRGWQMRSGTLCLVGALIYGSSGGADLFAALLFALMVISPCWFTYFTTIERGTALWQWKNVMKNAGIFMVLATLVTSLTLGEQIKNNVGSLTEVIAVTVKGAIGTMGTGTDPEPERERVEQDVPALLPNLYDEQDGQGVVGFARRMVERSATHYYSLNQFIDGHAQAELSNHPYPLSYIGQTIAYRVAVVTGNLNVERPEIQSISRLNFEILSDRDSQNEGTSPGALASFAFLMPLPFALVAGICYLATCAYFINQIFWSHDRYVSLLGGLVLILQMQALFQSPIDMLLILDEGFVFVVCIGALALITSTSRNDSTRRTAAT